MPFLCSYSLHRLIGWGQIRRGVVYKLPMSLEGGTAT